MCIKARLPLKTLCCIIAEGGILEETELETCQIILTPISHLNPSSRPSFKAPHTEKEAKLCPFLQSLSMYAAVRAPVPGVKGYWHNKGMFIHGGDESASLVMTTSSSSGLTEGTKKRNTYRLKHRG